MKQLKHAILVFGLISSVLAGGPPPESVSLELDRISQIMNRATMEGEFETVVQYHTIDVVVMPDFTDPIRGRKALEKAYRSAGKSQPRYHAFNNIPEKRWMSEGMIHEWGSFGMTVSSKEHPEAKGYYGSYFQIWEPVGDSYQLSFTIWNLDHDPR